MELNDIMTTILSGVSLLISIIAVLLSKDEKVLFMEAKNRIVKYSNITKLILNWENNSGKNIINLAISYMVFDEKLDELHNLRVYDVFLNPICHNSKFHYCSNIIDGIQFIRVQFIGKYSSTIPFVSKRINQVLWYIIFPVIDDNKNIIGFEIQSTYKNEINNLKDKNKDLIKNNSNRLLSMYNDYIK